jgi:adenylate cyclase
MHHSEQRRPIWGIRAPMPRLTLGRALLAGPLALALCAAVLAGLLLEGWGDSLLASAERLRDAAARRAEAMVRERLGHATAALDDLERDIRSGILDPGDPVAVEKVLFARLVNDTELDEVTLTRARTVDGEPTGDLAPGDRWQMSLFREGSTPPRIVTTFVHPAGATFRVDRRGRAPGSLSWSTPSLEAIHGSVADPTAHSTFQGALAQRRFGTEPLWTDLHYAERDAALPEARQRVVVTAMRVVEDAGGRFAGVARAGLRAEHLDEVARLRVEPTAEEDPHRIFLVDAEGRLLTRTDPTQPMELRGDDLRPSTRGLSPSMRVALQQPAVRGDDPAGGHAPARFDVAGRSYLLSVRGLEGTQDWRVGVLVPEDHYLGDLARTRRVLLALSLSALGLVLVLGGFAVRSVRHGLDTIVASAARMRDFDFSPSPTASAFGDVARVMEDLERAKTALRALGRYVPVDLVRRLYRSGREPGLGGDLRDVTLMFTDIAGFTSLAEGMPPAELAGVLGRYFEVMTAAIHATGGIVDKYIGDAVMAMWNAPETREDHAERACAAALGCREAADGLMAAAEWAGRPRFHTRFGIHRDEVLVGHFGAPDRISFTALGDGVNLASRLEGLNKLYETTLLASETVRDAAKTAFAFRLVDVVAVKGKSRGVAVYELVGRKPIDDARDEAIGRYESAFAAYQGRRFDEALAILAGGAEDGPSRVLAQRCRAFLVTPPPLDWDGVYVAREK